MQKQKLKSVRKSFIEPILFPVSFLLVLASCIGTGKVKPKTQGQTFSGDQALLNVSFGALTVQNGNRLSPRPNGQTQTAAKSQTAPPKKSALVMASSPAPSPGQTPPSATADLQVNHPSSSLPGRPGVPQASSIGLGGTIYGVTLKRDSNILKATKPLTIPATAPNDASFDFTAMSLSLAQFQSFDARSDGTPPKIFATASASPSILTASNSVPFNQEPNPYNLYLKMNDARGNATQIQIPLRPLPNPLTGSFFGISDIKNACANFGLCDFKQIDFFDNSWTIAGAVVMQNSTAESRKVCFKQKTDASMQLQIQIQDYTWPIFGSFWLMKVDSTTTPESLSTRARIASQNPNAIDCTEVPAYQTRSIALYSSDSQTRDCLSSYYNNSATLPCQQIYFQNENQTNPQLKVITFYNDDDTAQSEQGRETLISLPTRVRYL